MTTAQEFVNALRAGNYIQALNFYDYVRDKYSHIKNPEHNINVIFDDDDLNQCLILELLQTNLNAHDLPALNFLVKCIEGIESFKTDIIGKKMGGFIYAASMVCSFKESGGPLPLEQVTNKDEFYAFMDFNSAFSKAIYDQRDNKDIYSNIIYSDEILEPFNQIRVVKRVHHQFFLQLTHPQFIQYINSRLDNSSMAEEHKPLLEPITSSFQKLCLKAHNLNTRGYNKEANILTGFTNHMRLALWQIVLHPTDTKIEEILENSEKLLKLARLSSLKHHRGLLKYVESALNTFSIGINFLISKLRGRPTLKTGTIKDIEATVKTMRLFKKKHSEAVHSLDIFHGNNLENII